VGGDAIGRLEDVVVFVERGASGDVVDASITEVRANFARARIESVVSGGEERIEAPCPIYADCGGCQLQHLKYEAQLAHKTRMVEDALRLGKLQGVPVHACIGTPEWGYRNKMQLVASGRELGLYARHSHRVVPMEKCLIAHPLANEIRDAAAAGIAQAGWSTWDEAAGTGLVRHVLARVSEARREALVALIVSRDELPGLDAFVAGLVSRCPFVAGVFVNVNPSRTNVILGRKTRRAWGRDHMVEEVLVPGTEERMSFHVGPTTFFQVNLHGLEAVASVAAESLRAKPSDTLLDAYCGVGVMALLLASKVRRVVGIEEVSDAVEAARANARLNNVRNAEFTCGKVERELPKLASWHRHHDLALLDPPRKGCEPAVLERLAKTRVRRIVYVSCNPATLARDLGILSGLGYACEEIQPVDMFPQTTHVECVASIVAARATTPKVDRRQA